MRTSYELIENFCPGAEAEAMRAAVNAHFDEPERHEPQSHQVWNYWFVPNTYAYLRTNPEKVIGDAMADRFFDRVCAAGFERWGLRHAYRPYLSLYVAGCYQALHNDAAGGRLGYVYSLTRWNERNFKGGETLIFREGGYFGTPEMTKPSATENFYELIPARFNQLLVFDDRLPHSVPRIEGQMDPFAGRLVLHGHFEEAGITVEGQVDEAEAVAVIEDVRARLTARARGAYHGLLTVRLWVKRDGSISNVVPLLDRVLPGQPGVQPFDTEEALKSLRKVDFPPTASESRITVPLAFALE